MFNLKGRKEIKFESVGEFIKTHENGEHIHDFYYIGKLIGYELEKVRDDERDKKLDLVYFYNLVTNKIEKTTVPAIYGRIKYGLKSGQINYGDIVEIKYLGKKPLKEDRRKKVNSYEINFYDWDENKDIFKEYNEKILEEVPESKLAEWEATLEHLSE
ncbi:MAG: hypothetical protein B6I28_05150 [Fusobacteriia bacterium 4572_132]|nr:MAG: hypothetical protein B6I28_05150 [Fusobacteriia bacterium 4572_132]